MYLRATRKLVFSKLQIQWHLFSVRDASVCFPSHRQSPKGPQRPYHAWRRRDTVCTMRMYLKEMTLRQKNSLSNISSLHKWDSALWLPYHLLTKYLQNETKQGQRQSSRVNCIVQMSFQFTGFSFPFPDSLRSEGENHPTDDKIE